MKNKYFKLPFIFLYSLILAGLDSLLSQKSDLKPLSLETFATRALVIFAYWLSIRLVAEFAERHGRSYKKYMFLSAFVIPSSLLGFVLLAS